VKPEVVRIKGTGEVKIDGITQVSTIPIDISDLKQAGEKEASLDITRYGVQLDGELPKVSIEMVPVSANFRIKKR
jgi:hypothetical protein